MKTLSAHSIVLFLAFYFFVIQGHSALRAGTTGLGTNGQSCNSLHRQYKEGETLSYEMDASNRNGQETRNYSARTDGIVKKQSDGSYYEEYAWSNLIVNGRRYDLPETSRRFRQHLSLAAGYQQQLPPLGEIDPRLVGPTLDFMTFYIDLQLTMRQCGMVRPGDHLRLSYAKSASWANGVHLLIAEDAVDFDILLEKLDRSRGTATVVVRHIPPKQTHVRLPAEWMQAPVADTPNNWVQVSKENGKYVASVGKETFTVSITVDLADGKMLAASMLNPVLIRERTCTDASFDHCGPPRKYEILRQIHLSLSK
jgi:hypothetical protein